jgi:hypothetical protein
MSQDEFNEVLERRIQLIRMQLEQKRDEYANNNNVLRNFNEASRVMNNEPKEALMGMYVKHHVSVMDFVRGNTAPEPAKVREKIGDMINYLILLEALLQEEWNEYEALPF